MAKAQKPVCSECGSDNVTRDGILDWNVNAQEWQYHAPLDNTDCNECGGECNLKWIDAN